jgi:hypothetical protein
MGTVAAIISASLSDIGVGEKVMVLLLLLASCLALAVAATLVALVALGVAMPAALLLLCLEWLLPTSMRSPNTATASLTDRNGRAVSTSARSEAAAMPEQAANDKDYVLSSKQPGGIYGGRRGGCLCFHFNSTLASVHQLPSNEFPNSNKQGR